jgi:hypothetical protein
MPADRVLVIDEDLNPRLVTELKYRGRTAVGVRELQLGSSDDEIVIAQVFTIYDDPVLVTGDDDMPAEHADTLELYTATVATIGPPPRELASQEDAWERDIVHRWAAAMQDQEMGSIRRYYPSGGSAWTPRKRRHL